MTTIAQSKLHGSLSWFAPGADIARPCCHSGSTDPTALICEGAFQRRSHRTVTIANAVARAILLSAEAKSATSAATFSVQSP